MFNLAIGVVASRRGRLRLSLIDRMQTRISHLTHVGTIAFARMHAALFELMRGDKGAPRRTHSNSPVSCAITNWPCMARSACFSRVGRPLRAAPRSKICAAASSTARAERSVIRWAIEDRAGRGRGPGGRSWPRHRRPRRSAGDARSHGLSRIRSGTASGARRNPALARPRQSRARRGGLPDRDCGPKQQGRAASNCARRFRWPSSISRRTDPPTPTPSSRPPSKAFLRRRKCRRSPRRRRCSRRSRRRRGQGRREERRRRDAVARRLRKRALYRARLWRARETTDAFAEARQSHRATRIMPNLAADYGLWAGSYVHGDLSSMRAHAAFLGDAGRGPIRLKPASPTASAG